MQYNTNNWRDIYEDKILINGKYLPIIDIYFRNDKPHTIFYLSREEFITQHIPYLKLKKKEPVYRPYTKGEVKVNETFTDRVGTVQFSVQAVTPTGVYLLGGFHNFNTLFRDFIKPDGSPAGILVEES